MEPSGISGRDWPNLGKPLADRFGVGQWFHYQDYLAVEMAVELLAELGLQHLRTGISWADFFRPDGPAWYDWMMSRLRQARLELLVSVWHTPPSISEGDCCSSPPRRLQDYADFIDTLITRYRDSLGTVELWNEPNNRLKWNFTRFDPDWKKFGAMIGMAGYWAKERDCATALGGMMPVDRHWLRLMRDYGVLDQIDVVAIHGFPGMWEGDEYWWDWPEHWRGWAEKVETITRGSDGHPVWVTETGFATWDLELQRPGQFEEQCAMLQQAIAINAERVYWYSLIDLDPTRAAIEMTEDGGRIDHREYHLGLVTYDGRRKPAFDLLRQLGRADQPADLRPHLPLSLGRIRKGAKIVSTRSSPDF
ncbi:MAG TPA: family 1 glycosylhydrolase [Chthoniobacterales bacterium]